MIKTYQVDGMTCMSCVAKVQSSLESIKGVKSAQIDKEKGTAIIKMNDVIPLELLQHSLAEKYTITLNTPQQITDNNEIVKPWYITYKPILTIFIYILFITLTIQYSNGSFDGMVWMRHFMAGFFLIFSFFKFLNLQGFAESYKMYDVVAKRIPAWGYVYAFLEFTLGIMYLIDFIPFITNLITAIVMTVSLIGVLQSVLNKKKIQCACLGTVFNLPMSTITIIEDALMIIMSIAMLFMI